MQKSKTLVSDAAVSGLERFNGSLICRICTTKDLFLKSLLYNKAVKKGNEHYFLFFYPSTYH